MHTIIAPDDFHVHLREGGMMRALVPCTAEQFARALVMPNTATPTLTAKQALGYRDQILSALPQGSNFRPLMSIQVTPDTSPEEITSAGDCPELLAAKVYPRGMTTNSENGVLDYKALAPVYEAIQKSEMLLLLHGESPQPGVYCLDREEKFLETADWIACAFPELRVVLEHITTAAAADSICA